MDFIHVEGIKEKHFRYQKSIKQLPEKIDLTARMLGRNFELIDLLTSNLENIVIYPNLDFELIEQIDKALKGLKSTRMEITSSFSEIQALSTHLTKTDIKFGAITDEFGEALLQDVTEKLTDLNKRTLDLMPQLQELFKNHFTKIEDEVESTKVESTISSEIFAKVVFELLKNTFELMSELKIIKQINEDSIQVIEKKIDYLQKRIEDEFSVNFNSFFNQINSEISNLTNKIQSLEYQIKESPLSSLVSTKSEIKLIKTINRDEEEINTFLSYLYQWPTDKNEITRKLEEFRDRLLMDRETEAPYRVTASSMFRKAITLIQREERKVERSTVREIIKIIEKLTHIIKPGV